MNDLVESAAGLNLRLKQIVRDKGGDVVSSVVSLSAVRILRIQLSLARMVNLEIARNGKRAMLRLVKQDGCLDGSVLDAVSIVPAGEGLTTIGATEGT